MWLRSLSLRNFRCYDHVELGFHKRMTVLVGLNGRGKSAILDGVELALSALDEEPLAIESRDVRMMPVREQKRIVGMEQGLPVEIEADLGKLKVYRRLTERHGETDTTVSGKCDVSPIHVFAYYDTGRINREAYFFSRPFSEIEEQFPAIQKAVNMGIRRYHARLEYNSTLEKFVIFDRHDGELLAESSSDGARCILGMAADLAWRLALANPEAGPDAVKKTPGIVLIDEVDLLLHPSWQQYVLTDLQRIFPKVQFIVTTHSPQVLSTVAAECIRILDDRYNRVVVPQFSLGAESWQLLQDIQHVSSRPGHVPIVRALQRYLELISLDEYDSAEAKKLRQRLDQWAGTNDPVLVRADMDIRLRRMRSRS